MKTKLSNPLWTHLPALGMFIAIIVFTIVASPLPPQVATHFGFDGIPNDYGSPWMVFGIIVGIFILFLATSGIVDEIWARQEKKKSFNWFCLMDELFGGFMGGVYIGYLQYIKSGDTAFTFPWSVIVICAGASVVLAVLLEFRRPFQPRVKESAFGDTERLEKELEKKIKDEAKFIYWQSQNPFWVSLLAIVMPLIMVVVAVIIWFSVWWAAIIVGVSGVSMVMMYGGLRTSVTKEAITVRFGAIGSKVLQLKTADIVSLELKEFAPIADFGGYGIRRNKEMWAYYLRGTRGVKFTTKDGKKYLIGSDRPEELYAVAQAAVKGWRS